MEFNFKQLISLSDEEKVEYINNYYQIGNSDFPIDQIEELNSIARFLSERALKAIVPGLTDLHIKKLVQEISPNLTLIREYVVNQSQLPLELGFEIIKEFSQSRGSEELIDLIVDKLPLYPKIKLLVKNKDSLFAINLKSKMVYSFDDIDAEFVELDNPNSRTYSSRLKVKHDRFNILYGLTDDESGKSEPLFADELNSSEVETIVSTYGHSFEVIIQLLAKNFTKEAQIIVSSEILSDIELFNLEFLVNHPGIIVAILKLNPDEELEKMLYDIARSSKDCWKELLVRLGIPNVITGDYDVSRETFSINGKDENDAEVEFLNLESSKFYSLVKSKEVQVKIPFVAVIKNGTINQYAGQINDNYLEEKLLEAKRYPYENEIPEGSFIFSKDGTVSLPKEDIFSLLNDASFVPVLAYGSNASPEQLFRKFGKFLVTKDIVIPVIKTTAKNFDVVYAAYISSYGAIPATLAESPGTESSIFITLIPKTIMNTMNKTETNSKKVDSQKNGAYKLANLKGQFVLDDGAILDQCLAYIATSGHLEINGAPVSVKAIKTTGSDPANEMTEEEILAYVKNEIFQYEGDVDCFLLESILDSFERRIRVNKIKHSGKEFNWENTTQHNVSPVNNDPRWRKKN